MNRAVLSASAPIPDIGYVKRFVGDGPTADITSALTKAGAVGQSLRFRHYLRQALADITLRGSRYETLGPVELGMPESCAALSHAKIASTAWPISLKANPKALKAAT